METLISEAFCELSRTLTNGNITYKQKVLNTIGWTRKWLPILMKEAERGELSEQN